MKIKQNLFVAFVLLMLVPTFAWAKPRTKAQMKKTAASAINLQTTLGKHKMNAPQQGGKRTANQLRELKQTHTYTVFGYTDGGFAVISADDLAPELLGVSESNFVETDNPSFKWWLKAIDEVITNAVKSNKPLSVIKPDPSKYAAEVPTLLTTTWGQQMPYNEERTTDYGLCGNSNSAGAQLFQVSSARHRLTYGTLSSQRSQWRYYQCRLRKHHLRLGKYEGRLQRQLHRS